VSIVVSDASPLIGLAKIAHLHLLPSLYRTVTIPEAVYAELTNRGAGRTGVDEFTQATWLQVSPVTDRLQVDYLRGDLDLGEAEALVLARERQAAYFLVDEERGRTVAKLLHIPHIGTAGILVMAKQTGHIPAVAPLILQLRRHRFYLSDRLVEVILHQVGESL
jgi:predicted nucleic acid-binding protein